MESFYVFSFMVGRYICMVFFVYVYVRLSRYGKSLVFSSICIIVTFVYLILPLVTNCFHRFFFLNISVQTKAAFPKCYPGKEEEISQKRGNLIWWRFIGRWRCTLYGRTKWRWIRGCTRNGISKSEATSCWYPGGSFKIFLSIIAIYLRDGKG